MPTETLQWIDLAADTLAAQFTGEPGKIYRLSGAIRFAPQEKTCRALAAFQFEGIAIGSAEAAEMGLTFSEKVGPYRYLRTGQGSDHFAVDFKFPQGAAAVHVKILPWHNAHPIRVTQNLEWSEAPLLDLGCLTQPPRQLDISPARGMFLGRFLANGVAAYEPETLALLFAILAGKPGPLRMIDIGANIGFFSFVAAAAHGARLKIDAFEPNPVVAAVAREISKLNELGYDVTEAAFSSESGSSTFYMGASDQSSSLNKDFRAFTSEVQVPTLSLDDYARRNGDPDVAKIDVESFAPQVLTGARELRSRRKTPIILEVLPRETQGVNAALSGCGYSYFHIKEELKLCERIEGDLKYGNWLLSPTADISAIEQRWRQFQAKLNG